MRQQQHPALERNRQEALLPEEIPDQDHHETEVFLRLPEVRQQLPTVGFQFVFDEWFALIERGGVPLGIGFELFAQGEGVGHGFQMAGALPLLPFHRRLERRGLQGQARRFGKGLSFSEIARGDGQSALLYGSIGNYGWVSWVSLSGCGWAVAGTDPWKPRQARPNAATVKISG
jgi:hypothetical protein